LLGSLTVAKSNLMGEGLACLPLTPSPMLRAVSGTPFGRGGRVQGMFGTLHWMWQDEYTSFWRWAERLFEIDIEEVYVKGGRGRTKTTRKVGKLREGGEEEFYRSLGPRILRRTKEEVLKHLPPKQYIDVTCEMSGQQLRQYKQLAYEAEVVVPDGVVMANGVLAERTRARQLANGAVRVGDNDKVEFTEESCKVEQLMEILDEHGVLDGSSGKKVVIASQFNEFLYGAVIPALTKAGVEFHLLTGKTSDRQRDKQMDAFQAEGGPRVFIMNSKAGGISITLDAADDLHQLDRLDNPEDEEQLHDRIHRASRVHQVTIYRYETEGTIDTNVAAMVGEKEEEQFAILDGRRGLEFLRKVIRYQPPTD
jgi:SNF2 family DNA or RNA helicase